MTLPSSNTKRPGNPLGREQRIRRRRDFEALRKPAKSRAHPLVILRANPNSLPHPRFAFVVGRRAARQAVARNRVRRRLREAVRRIAVRPGWDLLFIARSQAAEATFGKLCEAVHEVAERARLLETPGSRTDGPRAKGPEEGT